MDNGIRSCSLVNNLPDEEHLLDDNLDSETGAGTVQHPGHNHLPLRFKVALVGSWCLFFGLGCWLASLAVEWPDTPLSPLSGTEHPSERQHRGPMAWSAKEGEAFQAWERQPESLAYVMVANDPPEKTDQSSLWSAMALARSIQQFTSRRMVLLTNYETFPDNTPVTDSFMKLGVEVRPFEAAEIPEHAAKPYEFTASFNKLQAWKLTDLEKVVWLDIDALAYRSLDWLFEREGMWGGRHDGDCKLGQPFLNSAILSLTPRDSDYTGLFNVARANPELSVHQVVVQHFRDVQLPVSLLTDLEAAYGRCMNSGVPSPYISREGKKVNGLWNTADYVHRSGGYGAGVGGPYGNICFEHGLDAQRYFVGRAVLNICQFHPLGAHWRMLFCEAATTLAIQDTTVKAFCSDHCYYWGAEEEGTPCNTGPIDGTPVYGEYYDRVTGVPGPDMNP